MLTNRTIRHMNQLFNLDNHVDRLIAGDWIEELDLDETVLGVVGAAVRSSVLTPNVLCEWAGYGCALGVSNKNGKWTTGGHGYGYGNGSGYGSGSGAGNGSGYGAGLGSGNAGGRDGAGSIIGGEDGNGYGGGSRIGYSDVAWIGFKRVRINENGLIE